MAWTERHVWQRLKINGSMVLTSTDISISESVDQLSRVAEVNLAQQPAEEPDIGDTILIEILDYTAGKKRAVFGGSINTINTTSQPWSMSIVCTDQLRKLDRVRQGSDLSLTGMSPKEALEAVLDYVGCTYDSADLANPDYTLGQEEPISWLVDTAGSDITDQLSTVFGCVLMTIGDDRIVWLSRDATPTDGTGSYMTATRGVSRGFSSHSRSYGDRTRVQNNWIVRGVTSELNENCTAQPWAKAVGENPQVGRRRRTAQQEFQSDLIQSEDLAMKIVRRMMRETNRLPDERTTAMYNDPNVHPCTKITIMDPTYGMGNVPTYASVASVSRQGFLMTLRLAAGPGGDEGTVTSGVDKVCNDLHSGLDWPGLDFDFPDFDFPDVDLGLDLDLGGGDGITTESLEPSGGVPDHPGGAWTCGIDFLSSSDVWTSTAGSISDV